MGWTPDTIVFLIGLAFCGLAGIHALVSLAEYATGVLARRKMFQVQLQTLEVELETARHRRRITPRASSGWRGFRSFVVRAKVAESRSAVSLYLVPQDRRPLPAYFPGQFVTLRVKLSRDGTWATRCYSLSDRPREDFYRCTVKELDHEEGNSGGDSVCRFIHQDLQEGDVIEVGAPAGEFILDLFDRRPAILLAGGIGITPLMSMIHAVMHEQTGRQLILMYGLRDGRDHAFKAELGKLESENSNLKIVTCYSRPTDDDQQRTDYDLPGRVTIDRVRDMLPTNNYDYFLCGPPPFLDELINGLQDWGVPVERIRHERFCTPNTTEARPRSRDQITIVLNRSDRELTWSDEHGSILECAEAAGIRLPHGCRKGRCGSCVVKIDTGSIRYPREVEHAHAEGECLTCSAQPESSVHLDV